MAEVNETLEDHRKNFDIGGYLHNYLNASTMLGEKPFPNRLRYLQAHEGLQDFVTKGGIHGDRLLVVGSGPVVLELAYLCSHYDSFVLSDLLETNLDEIRKWKMRDINAHAWSPFFKHFAARAGKGEKWQEKEEMGRDKISHLVTCDLLQDDPLAPVTFDLFDAILAPRCFGALGSKEAAARAIKNLTEKYLKPGGYFITLEAANAQSYFTGKQEFKYWAEKNDQVQIHEDAGLQIEMYRLHEPATSEYMRDTDQGLPISTYTTTVARKPVS